MTNTTHSRAELALALQRRSGKKKLSDETIRLWEVGRHPPPYDMLQYLELELKEPEEFILFGIRKGAEIRDERTLEYVSPEEHQLLNSLRHTAKEHRGDTLEHAAVIAKRHPAPLAQIRRFPVPKKP